jgi:hypothetical protein
VTVPLFDDVTERARVRVSPSAVDIAGPGHRIAIAWRSVAGATRAEVASALLTIHPAVAEEVQANANFRADGSGWVIEATPGKRVRAIGLSGFKQPGGAELTGSLPDGMRIAVAFPQVQGGGFDSPRFAVPAVGRQGAVPPTLTGATFANKVLHLTPSVEASRVRISLVTGANPPAFAEQVTELRSVQLTTHTATRNAKVTGPDGAALWQVPELDPDADPAGVDLRQALEAALNRKLQSGEPLQAEFMVMADAPARAAIGFRGAAGALVRTEAGIIRKVLEGDPVALAVDRPPRGPLSEEAPHSVVGDLTIRYDGLRILESVSDAMPAATVPVSGIVVGAHAAVRDFPPAVLANHRPARIGVVGRAPEPCELAIEFVEVIGDTVGSSLSPPAVLAIDPDGELRTRWVGLPPALRLDRPAGVRVRANRGRFFWAASQAGPPLIRVAIVDPDPGGRPVFLDSAKLADVSHLESHQSAFRFPESTFRGQTPRLHSDLFLTVDCSDLTLRYAR